MNPHDITREFEKAICEYTGAPFCVCVDNQSNALFLSLIYDDIRGKEITIPSHTYPSVPCEIYHAGGYVTFEDSPKYLKGAYQLKGSNVWDSALRFTMDMYIPNSFMCCSFTGPYKHLKLGKGGCILHDNPGADKWFRKAYFSGRNAVSYLEDSLDMMGWNFYMLPEIATKGLRDIQQFYPRGVKTPNEDIEMPYSDLSIQPIWKK